MADADPKMVSESAAEGNAEEEEMASSSSDSGEESESTISESSGSESTSCSSSCSGSSSGSRSNSRNRLYRNNRAPAPFRRAPRPARGASFLDSLPQAVRSRVQALRNIQEEFDKVDSVFLKAIHDLERKYAEINKPLNDRRYKIGKAKYKLTRKEYERNSEKLRSDEDVQDDGPSEMPPLEGEEEDPKQKPRVKAEKKEVRKKIPEVKAEKKANSKDCMAVTPEVKEGRKGVPQAKAEDKQPKAREVKAMATVKEARKRVPEETLQETVNLKRARKEKPGTQDPKRIPHYWLTVLKKVEKLGPMIQKYDEPILKFLSNVTLRFSKPGQPISYTFAFHFLRNPYFRNEVLLKTYFIKSKPDHNNPSSCGWEIEDCKGCKIDWRRGKDVTMTTTQSRTAATGEIEIQPRVVRNASFFNFFSPPEIPKIGKLEPREDAILDEDFQIGQILRGKIILKSMY
ncbi:nucleosome assembly protein 1-like 3 [Lemur catta]|uniref:nucleosome assembly protein 1-like 3 n=1 Tax=Lemur catta TaxID=9447 RepID=UPI001E266C83|nr:nucleosome assembly protein 1-like 3 [Lemur catta]